MLIARQQSKRQRAGNSAQKQMREIGMQLVKDRKKALAADEKYGGRDILTLLLKANMVAEANQRMSDADIIDRACYGDIIFISRCAEVPTFLVAGHETTRCDHQYFSATLNNDSSTLSWCLFCLAQHPEIQDRLREELRELPENPSPDALNALPYLDSVVRETLRKHAAAGNADRVALKDDVIPLSIPIVDKNGVTHTEIK